MTETRRKFEIQPFGAGGWRSDYDRYHESAHAFLDELEAVTARVLRMWPAGATVLQSKDHPALAIIVRKRDRLSDAVRIFSAMAVEGYLNFYGVVRMGEDAFMQFERLPLVAKVRQLLLICDGLYVDERDSLVQAASRIGERRNSLVHPKTRESEPGAADDRSVVTPEYARAAAADMDLFFKQFLQAVPGSSHLIPAPREQI